MDAQAYVNALVQRRVAPLRLIHEAFSAQSRYVTLPGRLADMGISPRRLLETFSQLSGLPIAASERLQNPDVSGLSTKLVKELRDVGAVPLGYDATGALEVAVISPEARAALDGLTLPRHRVLIALEQDAIGAIARVQECIEERPSDHRAPRGPDSFGENISIETSTGGVQGKLSTMPVTDIARLLADTGKDAEVQLSLPDGEAELGFTARRLTFARFGAQTGEEAFRALVGRDEGRVVIFYGRKVKEQNCEHPISELLEEAAAPAAAPAPAAPAPRPISFDVPTGGVIVPSDFDQKPLPDEEPQGGAPKQPRRRTMAGYEVYEELGRGAHGTVYRVRRPGSEEDLALKVIVPAGREKKHFEMRVNRELKVQAELRHRNIIAVLDFGPLERDYFLVTEYAEGGTLGDLLDECKTLPTLVIARLTSELLWGIDFAHERGVVHRDLKPGNILLSGDGTVKLGDFGLARSDLDPNESTAGAIIGTPIYMSPEQAMGTGRDHRCDLFTVGTLVYEMVTGENPFQRDNDPMSLMAVVHVSRPPLLDAVPWAHPTLDDFVELLHKANPVRRPDSAATAHTKLQQLVRVADRRHPHLMTELVNDPVGTTKKLAREEAGLELQRARALFAEGTALVPCGGLAALRAHHLDPDNEDAAEMCAQLEERWGYKAGASDVAETQGLERRLEQSPGDSGLLRQLWQRYGEEGRIERVRAVLEQLVRTNPNDVEAKTQLELLAGSDRLAPFSVR